MYKKLLLYVTVFFLSIFFNKLYIFGDELPTINNLNLEINTTLFNYKLIYPIYKKMEKIHIESESFKTYLRNNSFNIIENITTDELINLAKDNPVFVYNILNENNGVYSWYDTEYKGLLEKNIFLVLDRIGTDIVLIDSKKNQIWIDEFLFLSAWQTSNQAVLKLDKVLMDVPAYSQLKLGYPTGCEFVALGMMINYKEDLNVSISEIISKAPNSINPNLGYRGDPRSNGGFSIFPSALLETTRSYMNNSIDLTGKNIVDLKRHLSLNTPIVVWVNGLGFNVHAITLTGYDENGFYYNDPYRGSKDAFLSYEKFYKIWNKPIYDEILDIYYETKKALTY